MTINISLPVMHHPLGTMVNISTWRSSSLLVHYWATMWSWPSSQQDLEVLQVTRGAVGRGERVRERYGNHKSMTRRYMEKGADRLRKITVENMANPSVMYQATRPGTCPLTSRGKNGGRGEREMMRDGIFKVLTSRYLEDEADLLRKIIVENMANPSVMYQAARPGTCPLTSRGKNGGRGEREMMRDGIFKVLTSKYLVDEADLLRKIVVEHIANPSGMYKLLGLVHVH